MKTGIIAIACIFFVVLADHCGFANPYFDDEDDGLAETGDYSDNALDRLLHVAQQKRACVRRGGNCDHRPNDCCFNSSCRCNLWGSNCRCQRMGLFQKWG